MSKEKTAAIITIKRPEQMTERGRKDIAEWMRRQARFLLSHGDKMAPMFRARYIYR